MEVIFILKEHKPEKKLCEEKLEEKEKERVINTQIRVNRHFLYYVCFLL